MPSLIHLFQQHLAAGRQRREVEQFSKDLMRLIHRPGKAFTLGMKNISPNHIQLQMPQKLDLQPIPGNYGVAEVFIPCSIEASSAHDKSMQYWLQVRTVDGIISTIHITETQPQDSELSDDGAPADLDYPR